MSLQVGRVGPRSFRTRLPADQKIHDIVPDPVPGIVPEHVAGGFVVAVPRQHVPPSASDLQDMKYAIQRLLQVGSFLTPLLWQEGFNPFDVLAVQFEDARHGGFSFASVGVFASRAWLALEAFLF